MKKNLPLKFLNAFTLVELLAVLAIITILASLMVAGFGYMGRLSLEASTRAEVKALEAALEAYRRDNGGYPPLDQNAMNGTAGGPEGCIVFDNPIGSGSAWNPGNGLSPGQGTPRASTNTISGWWNSQFIIRALGTNNPNKIYYEFKPKQLQTWDTRGTPLNNVPTPLGNVQVLLDPYGNVYGYNPNNPIFNPGSFDLWSSGNKGISYYPNKYSISNENIGNWGR